MCIRYLFIILRPTGFQRFYRMYLVIRLLKVEINQSTLSHKAAAILRFYNTYNLIYTMILPNTKYKIEPRIFSWAVWVWTAWRWDTVLINKAGISEKHKPKYQHRHFYVKLKINSNTLQQQQQQPCQSQSLPRPLGHQIYNNWWWFPEKEWSLSCYIWLNCYCWGNWGMVEGRFSKWF